MGDKRINFNRPLLSVRRFSPTDSRRKNEILLPSPSYSYSGPLRNPGTVPFVWEQTPGRPKHETKTQKPPVAPNPPPGRILKPKKHETIEKDSKKEISHSRNDNGRENEKPEITYGPNFLHFNDDDNEYDSDFDYDEHANISFKFCGLLPQICLKGSIGILNQTPGISMRTGLPISCANRTPVGSSSGSSQDAYEPKSSVKQQKDLIVESTNQKNSQKLEQHSHGISDNHNESFPPEKKEVKGLVSFKELLAYENEKEAGFENPTIEKTIYVDKVEALESDFKGNDVDAFGSDLFDDTSKHDKEIITQTGLCNDPKVDQKVKVSPKTGSELPAPPPLPKSPSDSWLWRTLPSVNSKAASLWSNHKVSSKTTTNPGTNKGQLLSIPET